MTCRLTFVCISLDVDSPMSLSIDSKTHFPVLKPAVPVETLLRELVGSIDVLRKRGLATTAGTYVFDFMLINEFKIR